MDIIFIYGNQQKIIENPFKKIRKIENFENSCWTLLRTAAGALRGPKNHFFGPKIDFGSPKTNFGVPQKKF